MARLVPGQALDPTQFRSAFVETDQLPHGSITGAVGTRVEQLFEQFPTMWATKPVGVDGILTFDSITFTDPALHTDAPKAAQNAPAATGPLNLDVPIGPMPRTQLVRRLMQTPSAVVLGEGIRGDSEIESAAGIQGPVDVFVSPSRPAMKALGLETHRRLVKGTRLAVNTTTTAAAPTDGSADADPTVQQAPVFWLRLDPQIATQINALRATGALITVVPSGAALPSVDGAAVMCASADLCYRSLTEPSPEEQAAQAAAVSQPVAPTPPAAPPHSILKDLTPPTPPGAPPSAPLPASTPSSIAPRLPPPPGVPANPSRP